MDGEGRALAMTKVMAIVDGNDVWSAEGGKWRAGRSPSHEPVGWLKGFRNLERIDPCDPKENQVTWLDR